MPRAAFVSVNLYLYASETIIARRTGAWKVTLRVRERHRAGKPDVLSPKQGMRSGGSDIRSRHFFFCALAQVSLSETVRLKTGIPGVPSGSVAK